MNPADGGVHCPTRRAVRRAGGRKVSMDQSCILLCNTVNTLLVPYTNMVCRTDSNSEAGRAIMGKSEYRGGECQHLSNWRALHVRHSRSSAGMAFRGRTGPGIGRCLASTSKENRLYQITRCLVNKDRRLQVYEVCQPLKRCQDMRCNLPVVHVVGR